MDVCLSLVKTGKMKDERLYHLTANPLNKEKHKGQWGVTDTKEEECEPHVWGCGDIKKKKKSSTWIAEQVLTWDSWSEQYKM